MRFDVRGPKRSDGVSGYLASAAKLLVRTLRRTFSANAFFTKHLGLEDPA